MSSGQLDTMDVIVIGAGPAVARPIGAPWHMKGAFHGGSGALISYRPLEKDPFYKLPILQTLGAMYFEGEMTLAEGDAETVAAPLSERHMNDASPIGIF